MVEMDMDCFVNQVLRLIRDDELRRQMSQQAKVNVESISARDCAQRFAQAYTRMLQPDNNGNNRIPAG